ncbi:MAG TPA: ABC transporter substrate-binding protein, partial [Firmicutes bacterium]|nr:ABC transporter substrate-binding protein [Bacillota bacterium]
SYTVLATLVQLMGEDKAFAYWAELSKNIHHYNSSGSACVTQAGLGEVALGIAFSHDVIVKGVDKGYPVKLTFPKEGTGYEIGAMALVKGGQELDLAKKFIDYMLSKKGQDLMKNWFRIPLNPEAEVVEGAAKAADINLINFNEVWAGQNKERLIERWRDQVGQ